MLPRKPTVPDFTRDKPKQFWLSDGRVVMGAMRYTFSGVPQWFEQPHHDEESRWFYPKIGSEVVIPDQGGARVITQPEHLRLFGFVPTVM